MTERLSDDSNDQTRVRIQTTSNPCDGDGFRNNGGWRDAL